MAGKIAWVFFGITIVCVMIAAFAGPFRLDIVSISCAAVAVSLGVFGIYFAFESWKEE